MEDDRGNDDRSNIENILFQMDTSKIPRPNIPKNLVVFAILVLVANAVGANNGCTAAAAAVYFWARLAHFFAYSLGLPWVRTLAFAIGWLTQIAFAWQILT